MDLLAPEGYGEIIGGLPARGRLRPSSRENPEQGASRGSYDWYLDLRRYGTFVHSGIGMGISERVVAWVLPGCSTSARPVRGRARSIASFPDLPYEEATD
jgi:aspartyl/asparaginyl-tRNA synthetase